MMRVFIVIPTHNEEVVLSDSIGALWAYLTAHGGFDWEIVIADNGSTDRSPEIAREFAASHARVRATSLPEAGRGRALRAAWTGSDADVLAYMDVDLSAGLDSFGPLIGAVASGETDLSVGSRFASGATVVRGLLREATSRGYNAIARSVLGIRTRDLQCGFKAIRRGAFLRLAPHLTHPGWFFDTQMIALAERAEMRVQEIPVEWVEHRDERRKSSVRLARTIAGYLRDLLVFRARLPDLTRSLREESEALDQAGRGR